MPEHRTSALGRILAGLLATAVLAASNGGHARSLTGPAEPVPEEYFGLHIHRSVPTPRFPQPAVWPTFQFGSWRLLNALVSWPQLEPAKGTRDFSVLDGIVGLAAEKRIDLLYPFFLTPTWASARPAEASIYNQPGWSAEPRDLADWRAHVESVVRRYRGRVRGYEIWNEPNHAGYYTGTMDDLIVMVKAAHDVIRALDPDAIIVSPAATGVRGVTWLEEFARKGGLRFADVVGYHFYVGTPEAMVDLAEKVRAILVRYGEGEKPLWNTEAGWRIRDVRPAPKPHLPPGERRILSIEEGGAYTARAFLLMWTAGVPRSYWYGWDTPDMGMTDPDGQTVKPNAAAYRSVREWMLGTRVRRCESDPEGLWICELLTAQGHVHRAVWSTQGHRRIVLRQSWNVVSVSRLDGSDRPPNEAAEFVSGTPILLRSTPRSTQAPRPN